MQINSTTIIGAGGTGQHLIPPLVRLLTYHPNATEDVTIYDGDDFEQKNMERQIGVIGNKAEVMELYLNQQGLNATCIGTYVDKATFRKHMRRSRASLGVHLIIATVDNDATRKMCIEVLNEHPGDFLFVTPGNSDASDPDAAIKGNVLWYGRIDGEEVGIAPNILFPNIEVPLDGIPRKGSCLEDAVSNPQLIAANSLAAAYTLTIIQNFLDDTMPLQASHMFFNGRTLQTTAN